MSESKDIIAESLTQLNGENSEILFSTYMEGVSRFINLTVTDAAQTITLSVPFKLMGDFLKLTLTEIVARMSEDLANHNKAKH